jgi:RNA polymerase sigma factor (sigma-70 family)
MLMTSTLPASLSGAELREICQQRLSATVTQDQLNQSKLSALQLAEQVATIVQHNLASGRAQRVMNGRHRSPALTGAQLERYVDRVIARYLVEHQRIERLADSDDTAWALLQEWMAMRAYRLLQRWQGNGLQPRDEAADFAQQACVSIFNAVFPYDVPFGAWATVILTNHIRQRYTRSHDLIDRQLSVESLDYADGPESDERTSLYEIVSDPAAAHLFERIDLRLQIVDAIARLPSQAQQEVIIYSYLYGWSDDQLAEYLGKTRQAIYNLRHRALQQLRQTLEERRPQAP